MPLVSRTSFPELGFQNFVSRIGFPELGFQNFVSRIGFPELRFQNWASRRSRTSLHLHLSPLHFILHMVHADGASLKARIAYVLKPPFCPASVMEHPQEYLSKRGNRLLCHEGRLFNLSSKKRMEDRRLKKYYICKTHGCSSKVQVTEVQPETEIFGEPLGRDMNIIYSLL